MPHTLARPALCVRAWAPRPRPRNNTCVASTSPSSDTTTSTAPLLASLHAERVQALSAATLATRRADRLAPKIAALEAEALAAVKGGDEVGARAVLERKAAVVAAVEASRRRASASNALAAALAVKMERVRRGG